MSLIRDIFIEQGASFSKSFALKNPIGSATPFDLTGCSVIASMKTIPESNTTIVDFYCDIVGDPEDGNIMISLTPDYTRQIKPRKYVYDVVVIDSAYNFYRVIEGIAVVSPGITLDA